MYNKSHLVRFGNFLLKTYGVQVHSTDGKNQPIHQREVTDADMANWTHQDPIIAEHLEGGLKFKDRPADIEGATYKARYREGDPVILHFGTSGFIKNCRVTKVHFGGNRIAYDVEVKWRHEWEHHEGMPEFMTARLHNIDSVRVLSPQDFETI